MILGTIHPHNIEDFEIRYFYGNRASLWRILGEAFPKKKFDTLEHIKQSLRMHHVFISDTIKECKRPDASVTQDAKLTDVVWNKNQLEQALRESKIDTIFFTSGFGRNGSARLFCDMFRFKPDYDKATREFVIPKHYFGKRIRGVVLVSPSGAANKGIAATEAYKKSGYKREGYVHPVKAFKVDFYRKKFSIVFDRVR